MSLFASIEAENLWRFEHKYRLTYAQYLQVKNALRPFTQIDCYSLAGKNGKYLVRSLYFDSFDYLAYEEKLSGNYSRFKFRIRTYSPLLDKDTDIRAELKLRQGEKTIKHSAFISPADYCDFMNTYHWHCEPHPALIEAERHVHSLVLRPKVLVEYEREGWECRSREDVRITFDHHVRSAQVHSLFPPQAFYRPHNPHEIVLEIKHQHELPDWLKAIVKMHNLKKETNSKYCQGIEVTQFDLVNHALRV